MSKKLYLSLVTTLAMGVSCSQAIELGSKHEPFFNSLLIKSRNLTSNLHATCLTPEQIEKLELNNVHLNGVSCFYNDRDSYSLYTPDARSIKLGGATGTPKNFALGTYSDINRFVIDEHLNDIYDGGFSSIRKDLQQDKALWADVAVDDYFQEFESIYRDSFEYSYYIDDSHLSLPRYNGEIYVYKSISELEKSLDKEQLSAEDILFLNNEYTVSYDIASYLGNFYESSERSFHNFFSEYTLRLTEEIKYDVVNGLQTCFVNLDNIGLSQFPLSDEFHEPNEVVYGIKDIKDILTKDLNTVLREIYPQDEKYKKVKIQSKPHYDSNKYYALDNSGLYVLTAQDGQDINSCDYGVAFISYKDIDKYLTPKFKKNLPTYQKKVKMRF